MSVAGAAIPRTTIGIPFAFRWFFKSNKVSPNFKKVLSAYELVLKVAKETSVSFGGITN